MRKIEKKCRLSLSFSISEVKCYQNSLKLQNLPTYRQNIINFKKIVESIRFVKRKIIYKISMVSYSVTQLFKIIEAFLLSVVEIINLNP